MTDSLRERKKRRTKRALQDQALRLFIERGYAATTVDDIVAAADVSQRTFFRYFATKEDVLFYDEFDQRFLDELAARPLEEPVLTAIRETIRIALTYIAADDAEMTLARAKLVLCTPALSARYLAELMSLEGQFVELLAPRLGHDPRDLRTRVIAAAAFAALRVAAEEWVASDGRKDLSELLDEALDSLRLLSGEASR